MKKYFFLAATAAVALSSCSNEEITNESVLPSEGKTPIEFTAYAAGATRFGATEATISSLAYDEELKTGGFTLNAFFKTEEETDSMIIDDATYSANAQTGACTEIGNHTYYWPEEDTEVEFYAYNESAASNCTLSVDNERMNIVPDAETDIIAAYKKQSSGSVALTFKHLLAQVKFNVVYSTEYVTTLGGADNVSFVLKKLDLNAPMSSEYVYAEGVVTASEATQNYSFLTNGASVTVTNESQLVGVAMVPASGVIDENATGNATVDPTKCSISVEYGVSVNSGEEKNYPKTRENIEIFPGYLNVINITLSGDQPISVTAELQGWSTTEATPIEL